MSGRPMPPRACRGQSAFAEIRRRGRLRARDPGAASPPRRYLRARTRPGPQQDAPSLQTSEAALGVLRFPLPSAHLPASAFRPQVPRRSANSVFQEARHCRKLPLGRDAASGPPAATAGGVMSQRQGVASPASPCKGRAQSLLAAPRTTGPDAGCRAPTYGSIRGICAIR